MKVKEVMPDKHGTTFELDVKITAQLLSEVRKRLEKRGHIVVSGDTDYTFRVYHDRDISFEHIAQQTQDIIKEVEAIIF